MAPTDPPDPASGVLPAHAETRLLGGRVICLQPQTGYRTAIDPVFLAAAVAAKAGDRILDAGSGTGAASLCLAARVEGVSLTGVEIQPDYAALSRKSAELSGCGQRFRAVARDLAALPGAEFREFDHVMTNPPYMRSGDGRLPPDAGKARATVESHLSLGDWLSRCIRMTRSRGTVTVIHRADRLEHILAAMAGHLGGIVIFPLWPGTVSTADAAGDSARRVLVSGRKGLKAPSQLKPGLCLHNSNDGSYTDAAKSVLSDGRYLKL